LIYNQYVKYTLYSYKQETISNVLFL